MTVRRFIGLFLFVAMAGLLLGLQTPALAAERTVVLKVPSCV